MTMHIHSAAALFQLECFLGGSFVAASAVMFAVCGQGCKEEREKEPEAKVGDLEVDTMTVSEADRGGEERGTQSRRSGQGFMQRT